MNSLRHGAKLGAVGLLLLGLAALALSATALTRFRSGPIAEPGSVSSSATPSPSSASASASATPSTDSPAPSSTQSPTPVAPRPTVVILGDSASVDGPTGTWVDVAAEQLGWGEVLNLSSAGTGFLESPAECASEPCGTFEDAIPAVVQVEPDLVVTFGGTADGDYDLSDAAAEYFDSLRQALPAATLVAISPVTGEDPAPYFLTMHARTIGAAVEAVDGTMIEAGQPGSGDGDVLSQEAHAEIARLVVSGLS